MILAWTPDLRERTMRPEMMDQPDLAEREHRGALQGLVRVNLFSRTSMSLWGPIRCLAEQHGPNPLRVLDIACGAGDVPIRMARMARQYQLPVVINGCDISPMAIKVANERAGAANVQSRFFQFDVLNDSWPVGYDVITMSLFLHHLTCESAVEILASAGRAARKLVLVNDLVRSRIGYLLARFGSHLLSRSRIVHSDGPISVAGAFTVDELHELSRQAGLEGATIGRIWPARMLLKWERR